jgi:ABC-type branched-subunit amino acid transport system ATPase component
MSAPKRPGGTGDPPAAQPDPGDCGPPEVSVLNLDRLSLSFGGLRALSELDLQVDHREIVSLIGPNGAGKTTVFNVITGVYRPTAGDVRFAGQSIAGQPPHRIARMGIARTFQSLRLFLNMSVIENVMAATYGSTRAMPWESILRLPRARREEREVRALAEDVLSFFGQRLGGYRWDQPAYSLSYANRRRLEIARALATGPRLLLLDEPAAGMNPAETHEITELIGRLRDKRDVSILVIEHDMHVVAGCSDRVVALDQGVKIAEAGFDEVASHPAVVEAYMGRDPETPTDGG